ncbi:NIPSNAP family protein [Streptomyces sp. NBC_01283]|uniref:NIPSNAP family protein n=1 Tax=Streptomyces sp. NBC_01283 TaxID=2903812 RepID=UPI00352F0FEF|nr:NIPSNAP family protein [Streptomyces sp. NBC_01283]
MITVHLKYEIDPDPDRVADFEEYGRRWVGLVNRFGGDHHGYFLPSEGDSDIAYALFSFPSLAAYEQYRIDSATDPECQEAFELARRTGCIRRYERRFLRPLE